MKFLAALRDVGAMRRDPTADPSPLGVLGTATWFGLATGLLELAILMATKPLRDPSPGLFRMNPHVLWMIPTFDLALFATIGSALALVAIFRPKLAQTLNQRVCLFVLFLVLLLSVRRLHILACVALSLALAYRGSIRLARVPSGFRRFMRLSSPVLGTAVILLVALSIGRKTLNDYLATKGLPPPRTGATNVLLVVMDTVRADALSAYGNTRATTPNLDRLASRGVRFERAWSTAPWTLPSHCSIMTGRWPHELSADLYRPLDDTFPTLAEYLTSKGYATGGFVANTNYCGRTTGLGRGFGTYEGQPTSAVAVLHATAIGSRIVEPALHAMNTEPGSRLSGLVRKDAEAIRTSAIDWIDERGDRPFFAFLNFYDAHNPYVVPSGFDRHFGLVPTTRKDHELIDEWFHVDPLTVKPREGQLIRDAYDDCIAYLDDQLGRLFDDLDRRGILDDTLVIVTADHGEAFGEHGLYGHASSLYQSESHVPLLIVHPRGVPKGKVVPGSATLRDLPATIVERIGLAEGSPFPGQTLARCWDDDYAPSGPLLMEVVAPVQSPPNHGRSPVFRGSMSAVIDREKLYICNGDGTEELYDLIADPDQMTDLSRDPKSSGDMERLRAAMADLGSQPVPPGEAMLRSGGRERAE